MDYQEALTTALICINIITTDMAMNAGKEGYEGAQELIDKNMKAVEVLTELNRQIIKKGGCKLWI